MGMGNGEWGICDALPVPTFLSPFLILLTAERVKMGG